MQLLFIFSFRPSSSSSSNISIITSYFTLLLLLAYCGVEQRYCRAALVSSTHARARALQSPISATTEATDIVTHSHHGDGNAEAVNVWLLVLAIVPIAGLTLFCIFTCVRLARTSVRARDAAANIIRKLSLSLSNRRGSSGPISSNRKASVPIIEIPEMEENKFTATTTTTTNNDNNRESNSNNNNNNNNNYFQHHQQQHQFQHHKQ